jgi:predicted Zn-dependent protease
MEGSAMIRECRWFRLVAGLMPVLLLLVAGCSANPATGKQQLSFYNEQEEIAMGKEADADIVGQVGLYDDPAVQAYVSEVGRKLAAGSERPNLPWSFKVLDDSAINAFALPGGYVYVTRGILTHLGSEAELATVMGHEIGHVTARHSVNQMSKKTLATAGLGIALIFADSRAADVAAGVAAAGLGLVFLAYSRGDESQADELGLRYAQHAGFDLRQSPEVFRLLDRAQKVEGTGGQLPRFLATHPDPGSRRQRLEEKVGKMEKEGTKFDGTTVNHDGYLARLDGMRFGDDPRGGFVQGGVYYQPLMKLQVAFPAGWSPEREKDSVMARSPKGDAFLQVGLAGEGSPQEATEAFFKEDGLTQEKSWEHKANGDPAVWSRLTVKVNDSELRGTVVFVSHQGKLFQILSVARKDAWNGYQAALDQSMESFARTTDPKILGVQPRRLKIVQLKKAMTLEEFARAYPSVVPVETVALINHVEPGGTLEAGRAAKQVVEGTEAKPAVKKKK